MRPSKMPKDVRLSTRRKLYSIAIMLTLALVAPKTGEPRLARDQAGRTVCVPDNPLRVVSLAPSITEIVFALGEGDRLKGVTQHCDFPADAQFLPKVGSYVHLDLERIVALKPDLCIAVRDGNPGNVVTELEAFGIPVYAVDPRNLDTAVDTVLEVGQLLNAATKARHLANEMRDRIERVKERVAGTGLRPRVFFQIGTAPIVSAGTNTVIHELIAAAGGQNLAEGPASYPRFSREQVLALQPEVIIITSMTKEPDIEQVSAEWKNYEGLPAVRNNRIFIVDADLFDRATPRLINGLETLAGIIHPELFR
ncbi:MAG: cobalamin-binding protein [Syntrophobacteraceae bacterium]